MSDKPKTAHGSIYLIVQGRNSGSVSYPNWVLQSFKVLKQKPDLARDEIAIKVKLALPVALFEKPQLQANIEIEGDVPVIDLSPETIQNVQDVLKAEAGLDVCLTVVNHDD